MKKLLTLIFIILFLTTCIFEQASEKSYSDLQKADISNLGVDLPEAGYSRKYCATLESIALAGDFERSPTDKDPELYGRICASTSQDKLLLNNKLDLNSRLGACKDLWREYDDDVFAANLIKKLVGRFSGIFRNPKLLAISKMYQGNDTPTLVTNRTHLIMKGETLSLSDHRNHRLIVIFLPIIDDDASADEVLIDSHDIKNRNSEDDYPIIIQALPSELPTFGDKIYKTQTLEDSKNGGKATFTFSFKTGACD